MKIDDDLMQKASTHVDWPQEPSGAVLLNCTLRHGTPDIVAKARKWDKLADETFRGLISALAYAKVSTLQDLWSQVPYNLIMSCYCSLPYLL